MRHCAVCFWCVYPLHASFFSIFLDSHFSLSPAHLLHPLATSPIKHVVTLMMENRAFDHMLGHLGLSDPRIDGLQQPQSNPVDPAQPHGPTVPYSMNDALDGGPFDPPHGFDQITFQVRGRAVLLTA